MPKRCLIVERHEWETGGQRQQVQHQPALRSVYQSVGTLDMAQSIASFRAQQPSWCLPSFNDGARRIAVTDLRHPAVPGAVGNDVTLDDERSLLVTGSNMSG